ncbi:hypothetical protein BZA05DRAFT_220048 [Tricharina praecox]|uniref:uncharacterized protein n=1 Tax=Tricharina praecox TaxID=43433 RepID=UPI00221F3F19|nr:uncharacterized protein BZA05DRAFT_220048 [Tricharina praecox]KAI5855872.1 hypothetical protein BZA05DRAFT_220048 [Tricharina praecox]
MRTSWLPALLLFLRLVAAVVLIDRTRHGGSSQGGGMKYRERFCGYGGMVLEVVGDCREGCVGLDMADAGRTNVRCFSCSWRSAQGYCAKLSGYLRRRRPPCLHNKGLLRRGLS